MAGIRIQHPSERSCVFTLVAGDRPYEEPYQCPVCHLTHVYKTYHLTLDAVGATIVSPEIVARLKAIPDQPFTIGEEIDQPPAQRIVAGNP